MTLTKSDRTDTNRLMKITPKYKIQEIIELTCVGIEIGIANKIYFEKKSVVQICEELHISESMFHIHKNRILEKTFSLLRDKRSRLYD